MEEYRAPAELLNEKGKLARPGWSAQDDFIYNKEAAGGGLSEWERYFVTGASFALEISYGHTRSGGIAEVRLTDLETDERYASGTVQAFPGDAFDLDFSCGEEHTVKFENDDLYLLLTHYGGVRRIQFRSERFEGDLSCANDGDGIYTAEALAGKQFYYRGFRCFPGLSGYLRMHNRDLPLDAQTFLFSESVRAVMPRGDVYLRAFGSACVDGHVISLALSDGADSADENALFYDGTLCKLGRVYMKRSASDPLRPWYVSDMRPHENIAFVPLMDTSNACNHTASGGARCCCTPRRGSISERSPARSSCRTGRPSGSKICAFSARKSCGERRKGHRHGKNFLV